MKYTQKQERVSKILDADELYGHPHTGVIKTGYEWIQDSEDWEEITEDQVVFGNETNTLEMQAGEFEHISDYDAHTMYDEMLNDCHEMVNICGYEHLPADCLKAMDPIAYRCGFHDYIDSLSK